MKRNLIIAFFAFVSLGIGAQKTIDLSGQWQFQVDRESVHTATSVYDDVIQLPGSMTTRGKGNPVTVHTRWVGSLYDSSYYFNPYMKKYQTEENLKFPFFLTPTHHYVGIAWYRRSVCIPLSWRRQRVLLTLERPHIETTVYVNGNEVGHQIGLSAPHVYDVTAFVRPGNDNTIAVRVYNGIENVCVGQDSHSVTDQTQGDWNGIVGRIALDVRPMEWIEHVDVYPDVQHKLVKVCVKGNARKLAFEIDGTRRKAIATSDSTYEISLGENMRLWDEFNPYVYKLAVVSKSDRYETVFGMRNITTEGRHIMLNGRTMWVRGTVGNCCFPETGYPPTDVDSWLSIFRKCREYGLNTMRFHSYCPPEAAFVAADQLGFYLQPEGPSWPNHGVKLRAGQKIDQYLMDDTRRIVEAYGNHPSFVMFSAGNEPAGGWVEWCRDWVNYWKKTDSRRIYCGANVGGGWAWDQGSQYHVKGGARGLDWNRRAPHSDDDYYESIIRFVQKGRRVDTFDINEPYISHEQGQWCAFPDLKETSQYTGAYKARNFEIFADLLRDHGMESQSEKFLNSSGSLQTLAYKFEMERNFRTPDYTGFVLLGLNDYSGQGTALVGPLNVHWREKGYVDGEEWRQFCNTVVPLARFPRFVYTDADTLVVPVEVYNASEAALPLARVTYTLTNPSGVVVRSGLIGRSDIPLGKNNEVGAVTEPLRGLSAPQKLILTVTVGNGDSQWQNTWPVWVYPSQIENKVHNSVLVADSLDSRALATLRRGGRVLLTAAGRVRYGSDIKQTYLPVFWNTSWFKMRPPHTTGAYIDASHPVYREFPTDDWTNLNWWELVNNAQVMNLSEFPANYQPPMQPIDTWHVSRKCGMIVEANVLGGKLLMTTIDISSDLDRRIVARQLRRSILDYMESDAFAPELTLEPSVITHLYERQSEAVDMYTNDSPDELKPKLK